MEQLAVVVMTRAVWAVMSVIRRAVERDSRRRYWVAPIGTLRCGGADCRAAFWGARSGARA